MYDLLFVHKCVCADYSIIITKTKNMKSLYHLCIYTYMYICVCLYEHMHNVKRG